MAVGDYPDRAVNGITTFTITSVAIDDSPSVLLIAAGVKDRLRLHNRGTDEVYLGNTSGVTSATGFPLLAGQYLDLDGTSQAWYGICATGETCTVSVIKGILS